MDALHAWLHGRRDTVGSTYDLADSTVPPKTHQRTTDYDRAATSVFMGGRSIILYYYFTHVTRPT